MALYVGMIGHDTIGRAEPQAVSQVVEAVRKVRCGRTWMHVQAVKLSDGFSY